MIDTDVATPDPAQVRRGFGPDPLNPYGDRPAQRVSGSTRKKLRAAVAAHCPRVPGVYGMFDDDGELVYIGKSLNLRSRLMSYFGDAARQEKGGRIVGMAKRIGWETQPNDFAARVRELNLIRRFRPKMNVQGMPDRQRPVYLVLGRKPAEYFFTATAPPSTAGNLATIGPLHGMGRLNTAVDALNKVFKLRDCSQKTKFHYADQMALFDLDPRAGCIRLEIGTCLGPCAGACTRGAYREQLAAAEAFLDGINDEPLTATETLMQAAAERQQYELAGRARDTLKCLQYVQRKLNQIAEARRQYSFIYPAQGYDGRGVWYLVRRGEVIEAAAAPHDPESYESLKPTLRRWKAMLASGPEACAGDTQHTVAIVASWFRKHRGELKRVFAPAAAGRRYHRQTQLQIAGAA